MITDEERQKMRKKRQRARKRKKIRKNILLTLAVIIILLAVFVITIKIVNPDFFEALYDGGKGQQVIELIDSKILGKTTETQPQSTTEKETTTKVRETNKVNYDYDDFGVFAFDTSLQGNQVGNLLNKTGGAVTYSSSYIYYSVSGKGIFRFEPNEEKNSNVIKGNYNFKYLKQIRLYLHFEVFRLRFLHVDF